MPKNIIAGSWCPKCAYAEKSSVHTIEEMHEIAHERGGACLSDSYKDTRTPLKWRCKEGHIWPAPAKGILKGHWCPKCGVSGGTNKKTLEDCQALAKKRGGECLSTEYVSNNENLEWRCKEGHTWFATLSNISAGHWCAECAGNKKKTIKECQRLARERGGECISKEYKSSHAKLEWRCAEGHIWSATRGSVASGKWCPICSGRTAWTDNNLEVTHPEITAEWHPTKNGDLSPKDFKAGSGKKVWWKCSHNPKHEWPTKISHRTGSNSGCPYCAPQSSRIEIRAYTELKALFPEAIWRHKIEGSEADIFIPELDLAVEVDGNYWHKDFLEADKNKNVLFRKSNITTLRLREAGLPQIEAHDVIFSSNDDDLITIRSLISAILDLTSGQVIKDRLANYLTRDNFCNDKEYNRILSYLPAPPPEESLLTLEPKVAKDWHNEKNNPLKPEMFKPRSGKTVWWRCSKNPKHEWKVRIITRTRGNGCPFCAGIYVLPEESLAGQYPDIAKEWHPTKNGELGPDQVTIKSGKKVWWQCSKDSSHEWPATVSDRTRGQGCPFCSGRYATKENNLAVLYPQLAAQWHPTKNGDLRPDQIKPGSTMRVWWYCPKHPDQEWQLRVEDFKKRKSPACPICREENAASKE
jgi:Probable Zinc-ribbon domain